jgi:hypothetical protein
VVGGSAVTRCSSSIVSTVLVMTTTLAANWSTVLDRLEPDPLDRLAAYRDR